MLHANQLEFGPRMVRLRCEKKTRIFQRLAQTGGGDDFKIQIELRGTATIFAIGGGMQLRHDARAQRAEFDRRAFIPMTTGAGAPLREPGEQAAIIVEKRADDAVLVREQKWKEIAEPAEQNLVLGVEQLRPIRGFVAETPHLEEIARAFLKLRRIDAQVDLHARLEWIVTGLDFPDDAQLATRVSGRVFLPGGKPVEQFLLEGIGLPRRAPAARSRAGADRAGATRESFRCCAGRSRARAATRASRCPARGK